MLKQLKFVQGAVAKRDLMPAMTHFRIENGFVRAYNGILALCSPIDCDINCIPKADKMVKAISRCNDVMTMSMHDNGRLEISSGPFHVFIDCIDDDSQHIEPAGERVDFDGEGILKALKALAPFIGEDASRPWTNGVLLRNHSAFATNNVCLVEYWLGVKSPVTINLPEVAITEMLRINEPPTHAQMDQNSITFHYSDGRWIRSQLLDNGWPDIERILNVPSNATPIDPRLFEALETLDGFTDKAGRVFMRNGILRTEDDDAAAGAGYEVDGLGIEGAYQIKMLRLLKDVATHADFTRYPEPTMFFGNMLRGAILGMRMTDA